MRLVITLLISISIAIPASAQVEKTPSPNTSSRSHWDAETIMQDLDQNSDGRLNYMEAMSDTEISDKFIQMDLNKNGFLSIKELREPKRMNANQFKVLMTFASLQCI
ncbi:hypothetical protein [Neptunomonas antarctica]|uniref:EF hand n=1 Tax=Neptunomonas antarctica TaxID=619304 RepID=A0A1N7M790_9GAMM|nr:hypothetical protein [Neptunomonas antarctica]SIS81948.1 EF hand [Neptunomonas antarctica]